MTKIRNIEEGDTQLTIPVEKVCFFIVKARQFDAKDVVTVSDRASNPSDDRYAMVLEDHGNDPVLEEMVGLVQSLSEDERIDLVALMWLGRDGASAADWPSIRQQAADEHGPTTARYLCGTPLLADYLADGLSMLGYSCADYEADHL
ncbi:DUF3775 domain-containing protein [Rhodoligotrophos defluvii]|uniref:DUF3775 domain-containing protein n=1 Tax=Rhodoligotrophos defluvii TaxID=2561934 RepID=UPI0010C9C0FD|nr:DUF3775 domain-containing protein [Rhodoligotrophos defluvii]